MTTAPFAEMERLRQDLVAEGSGIEANLTTFPAGAAMLDMRRNGRSFVMAYTPRDGFGVDELQPNDGFVAAYRFVFKGFEPAARQLRTLAMSPDLSLFVLRSGNIEASKDFYSLLGLSFCEEKHGKGPRHYAATLGSLVLEIYPCHETPRLAGAPGLSSPICRRYSRIVAQARSSDHE